MSRTRLRFLKQMTAGAAGGTVFLFADEANAVNITISISGDGSALRDTVLISASLAPTKNLQRVEFFVDNQIKSSDTGLPFEYAWDTTQYPDGKHTLRAEGVYKQRRSSASLDVTVANVAPPPPPPPPPTGSRDAALWPFTSTSAWNYPIGSGAQYTPETSPLYNAAGGGVSINAGNGYSIPVYISTSADPLVDIYQGGIFITRMRVPSTATPAQGSDGHMAVIDLDHKLLETYGGITRSPGRITAPIALVNSVEDAGIYAGWHGTRAYGGSSIGGLIRSGELADGKIPHALAASVERASYNKNTPNGQGYVWPASNADSGWQTSYGSTGNCHMGTLLAIPPGVDVTALGLNAKALAVAHAMQDYGVYLVDASAASDGIIYYAEPPTESQWDSTTRAGLRTASHLLQVVTNNRSDNVGGGGTPRQPLAPAFS